MQVNKYKDFIKEAFNIDIASLKEEDIIDVSKFNVKIKSYNIPEKKTEFNKVLSVIRKKDALKYIVTTENNIEIVVSGEHRFYCKIQDGFPGYAETKYLNDLLKDNIINILHEDGNFTKVLSIIKSKEYIPIYDLQVEKVQNYYSDSLLSHNSYVVTKTTPGGNALRFYASMRFEISKSLIKDKEGVKGVTLKVKCVKNKLAKPFLETELECIYGEGIDKLKDLLNMGIELGIIEKAGAGWMSYGDVRLQGLDNFKQLLLDNPELEQEIRQKITEKL